jgi:hypothetical protein
MAFEKVIKFANRGCGNRAGATEQIMIQKTGKAYIPTGEMNYFDSQGLGGTPPQFVEIAIDTADVNHKIQFTPTNNNNEFKVGRKDGTGHVAAKAFKKINPGVYFRTGKLLYEFAGM